MPHTPEHLHRNSWREGLGHGWRVPPLQSFAEALMPGVVMFGDAVFGRRWGQ